MQDPGNYINGRFEQVAKQDGRLDVFCPADISQHVSTHGFAVSAVDQAVAAARSAQKAWRNLGQHERQTMLRRYADALKNRLQDMARAIALEVGKPLWESEAEVRAMIQKVDISIDAQEVFTSTRRDEQVPGEIRYKALGVIAVVGPFNFPGHLPNGQIVPALLAGNTVVFKPSEKTPGAGTLIAQCVDDAGFAPGIFNLVQGDAEVAKHLVRHDDIDAVLFTGSRTVGQAIVRANIDRPERLIALELGGKNSALVFDDADIAQAAREIAFASFVTAGQRCTATSQVLVAPSCADALISKLSEYAKKLHIGYPLDGNVFMGPVISRQARERILKLQQQAHQDGFRCLVGASETKVAGREGWYMTPSVHLAPTHLTHSVYREEELFGPDCCVYITSSDDEAIALANATRFGLAASVFTRNQQRFDIAARELDVGVVHFNKASTGASSRLPFGGIKESGNHRPGALMMGLSCAYAQAVQWQGPQGAHVSWPGFPIEP